MKKVGIILGIIIGILLFALCVRGLLNEFSENDETNLSTKEDYIENGWEVEAEYNYSGEVNETDLEVLQDGNVVEDETTVETESEQE